jgi:hypothetical protein
MDRVLLYGFGFHDISDHGESDLWGNRFRLNRWQ